MTAIRALVSDVDGTLMTHGKELSEGTRRAVERLHESGIAFAAISGRPPRGMRMLVDPLGITAPIAGFNGGLLTGPNLAPIEAYALAPDVAQRAHDLLAARKLDIWVFSGQDWLLTNPNGSHVPLEKRTVQFEPTVVKNFDGALAAAYKIVAVSEDYDYLARCETEVRAALGPAASASRSQRYYLDITHPRANKGVAVHAFSRIMGIPLEQMAVIGDGGNDVAMFEQAGLSIAMGNASAEVQQKARFVTASNEEDGFAQAVEKYILG
jgi:Cof subfamily protein (haloacid dehalogenase superfamily)